MTSWSLSRTRKETSSYAYQNFKANRATAFDRLGLVLLQISYLLDIRGFVVLEMPEDHTVHLDQILKQASEIMLLGKVCVSRYYRSMGYK